MTRRPRSPFGLAFLPVFLGLLSVPFWMQLSSVDSASSVVLPEFRERVYREGRVRVLAEMRLPGAAYASMTNGLITTDQLLHSAMISGLTPGTTSTFYVRCQDTAGNATAVDLAVSVTVLSGPTSTQPFPTNNNPHNQIRFNTPAEALAKRRQLTDFIWSGGLPTTLPAVTTNVGSSVFSGDLSAIDQALVAQVSRLDANVSGFDFVSVSYLLRPVNQANVDRFVLVHQGHSPPSSPLDSGVARTVNWLLREGYSVSLMQMPLMGWNTNTTATVPGQGALQYSNHDEIITTTSPAQGGMGFRLFLEPIIQTVNYFATLTPSPDVSMTGISGGGWSTHLAAAIDPRIRLSIPVAGSAPLYVRNQDPESIGDTEQTYLPLFAEDIATDGTGGGVATWLEIYALGGYGAGRRQIMVTNLFDPCCFSGTFADTFKAIVAGKVESLADGAWEYYADPTTTAHEISLNTLNAITLPALAESPLSVNVALQASGGVASASSTYRPTWPVAAVNNNERAGVNFGNSGGRADGTNSIYPDWVQITFNGTKSINRVVLYTVQDNWQNPIEPTDTLTFTQWGVTDFTVQGWNGSAWVTLATVTGNNLVKRSVTFPAFSTDRIVITVTNALAGSARITEIEAWSAVLPTTTALTSSLNPATAGTSVTFTATVTGSAPTGSVSFTDGGSALTSCSAVALSGTGTATCSTSSLTVGSHSLVASYGGNSANAPSTSAALAQVVTAAVPGNVPLQAT